MKEIYSFKIERKVEKTIPYIKKTKDGSVESTKKVIECTPNRVVFVKPSMATIEEAEFFYGQKFNEYINSGFLTKAMLNKKMGDIGGFSSKISIEKLQKSIIDNMEASRTIEFFGESTDLTEEQKEKLQEAKGIFVSTKNDIFEHEQSMRSQFSQTADAKAEQKLIEWLVFNLSYYEEEVDSKKQLFPIFQGDSFDQKRRFYLELCESIEDIDDQSLLKIKNIFDQSFNTLVRTASIWYNKIAEKQEDIEKAINEMFGDSSENLIEDNAKIEADSEINKQDSEEQVDEVIEKDNSNEK
jgi:hypothetical protein